MKVKFASLAAIVLIFTACNTGSKKKFEISGVITNAPEVKVYLEEIPASKNIPPQILDTVVLKNGKFSLQTTAGDESMYRIRLGEDQSAPMMFIINDESKVDLQADWKKLSDPTNLKVAYTVSTPANQRLNMFFDSITSFSKQQYDLNARGNEIKQSNTPGKDSLLNTITDEIKKIGTVYSAYVLQVAQTDKSPVIALYAFGYWSRNNNDAAEIEKEFKTLVARFPNNTGVKVGFEQFQKEYEAFKKQQEIDKNKPGIGKQAPDISLPDVNGNIFSLSSLKGKYVLVDFWASWCGPCRAENPNVVAAYNKYKDKNFTILGVSLDRDKEKWKQAIAEDGLNWTQVSDLKFWQSAVVPLYGFEAIPYNVLIDPNGVIIATGLRGSQLEGKLEEILK